MNSKLMFQIGGLLFFIAVAAAIIYAGISVRQAPKTPDAQVYTYNLLPFQSSEGFWLTQIERDGQLYNLQFRYFPTEVENVPMNGMVSEDFSSRDIYVTFDPKPSGLGNLTIAAGELSLNLARGLDLSLISSCTSAEFGCEDRPIVTCENTSLSVIYLRENPETGINLTDNCITVQGEGKELIRSVDHLLYVWYRIIRTE